MRPSDGVSVFACAVLVFAVVLPSPATAAGAWTWGGATPTLNCTATVYLVSDADREWVVVAAILVALLFFTLVTLLAQMQQLDPAPDGFHYEFDVVCNATAATGYVGVTIPDALGQTVSFGTWDAQNGRWVEQYSTVCGGDPCTVKWLIPVGATLYSATGMQTQYPTAMAKYIDEVCLGVQVVVASSASYSMLVGPDAEVARQEWEMLLGADQVQVGPPEEDQTCQDRIQWKIGGAGTGGNTPVHIQVQGQVSLPG